MTTWQSTYKTVGWDVGCLGRSIGCQQSRKLFWTQQAHCHKRYTRYAVSPRALQPQGGRQTRLVTRITTIPRRVDLYFAGNLLRQSLWAAIAFSAGYYSANTVSLSFGALAINDVVAAAVTVGFCEVCSRFYYAAPKATLKLIFINAFKMGVTAALIVDAFKLGG